MEERMHQDRTILIGALALGALGGLLLGSYLWRSGDTEHRLSTHLGTLSRVVEEIEELDLEASDQLKERIEDLIKTIKENYGKS